MGIEEILVVTIFEIRFSDPCFLITLLDKSKMLFYRSDRISLRNGKLRLWNHRTILSQSAFEDQEQTNEDLPHRFRSDRSNHGPCYNDHGIQYGLLQDVKGESLGCPHDLRPCYPSLHDMPTDH